jgi:hypothetical protein
LKDDWMPSGRIIEQQAGRLVAHILDADLEPHDIEGRQGAHDFDLILPGGERAALEVTSVVDAVLITLDHEMARQGHVIPAPALGRRWDLHLAEDACPPPIGKSYAALKRRVEAHAPMVLVGLETQEVRYFQLEEWGMQPRQAAPLAGLGIEFGGCSSQPVPDGSMTLLPPGGGGAIGPSLAVDAALAELEKNRDKLRRSGRQQRHFFAWIDGSAFLTWLGFDSGLPTTIPKLGAEATTLWCGGRTQDSRSYHVWRLTPPSPWQAYRISADDIGAA